VRVRPGFGRAVAVHRTTFRSTGEPLEKILPLLWGEKHRSQKFSLLGNQYSAKEHTSTDPSLYQTFLTSLFLSWFCLSLYLSLSLPLCPSVSLSLFLSLSLSLSLCLSVSLSLSLYVSLSLFLSLCLSLSLSLSLSLTVSLSYLVLGLSLGWSTQR
jgi:hypothetical protein